MSRDFIEKRHGKRLIEKAAEQQKQLKYFTQSDIQKDISIEYLNQWVQSEYRTNDYFLNFIKTIFRIDNFLSFYKYYRFPAASAAVINDTVVPAFKRVFFSEDSYFRYTIKGNQVEEPEELNCKKFEDMIFNAVLFNHNNILVHDLKDINEPIRHLVDIDNVVAIKSHNSEIEKIAFSGECYVDDVEYHGYIYMDSERFSFYDKEYKLIVDNPHDLGECPADYIVPSAFADDDPVRKSIFSYVREKMEEYVFLKTLQRLTEPNGAFPVTTKLKTTENKKDDTVITEIDYPMSSGMIPRNSGSPIQAGSIVDVPAVQKQDGSIDMDAVIQFFNFFYVPTDILEFINKRVDQIESKIVRNLIGDFKQENEDARNELDVKKGYVSMEDRLRSISDILTRIRKKSDFKFLALKYGKDQVDVECFYGSDFFLETEHQLYERFAKAPNPIERKHILKRLANTRNKFNPKKAKREAILYDLIPFSSDKDFGSTTNVDQVTSLYQTRFDYWISKFEAEFGDIVSIWDSMEDTPRAEKLLFINTFIENYIKDYVKTINSNVQNDPISTT